MCCQFNAKAYKNNYEHILHTIRLRMFYIVIHERNSVISFVPQCFSICLIGRHFEFQTAIFIIYISIKGDASFPGTTFPITTFLGTKFRVRIWIRVCVRVRIMV